MPNKLIKDRQVIEDQWQLITNETDSLPSGSVIVPLAYWQAHRAELAERDARGVWLDSDQPPSLIADSIDQFDVIAINFPAFADGRGFSYARQLREQFCFTGELRAIGHFMRDQLFYLKRCGFNAFALENGDLEQALSSFDDFSDSYQASVDQAVPLFRRR